MQQHPTKRPPAPTLAHEAERPKAAAPVATEVAEAPTNPFLSVLITPKLSFSLPRKTHWATAEDIPQSELSAAFLSRFPAKFVPPELVFKCATPALPLRDAERLVFRVASARGGDDEKVRERTRENAAQPYAHRQRS